MAGDAARNTIDRCPVCEGTSRRPWLCSLGFELVWCNQCGHRYAVEALSSQALSGDYYDEGERHLLERVDSSRERRFEDEYLPLLASVECTGGRVLDVGCNTGDLLMLFQRAGWDVSGIELSPGPAHVAESRLGRPIYLGDAAQVLPESEKFDLITLTHVLEHVPAPKALLQHLAERVARRGTILVEVPNANDPLLSIFGGSYRPLCAGDHVSFFDAASLTRLAAACDLEVVALQSPVHARDVVYPTLLSAVDLVRAKRRGAPPAAAAGVQTQTRYRGRLRRPARLVLDRVVDWADPLVQGIRPWTRWSNEGSVLVAVIRPGSQLQ